MINVRLSNWSAADAYLFDIDGTLLNTRDGVHYHAFRNAVRAIFDVEASIEGVPVHGNTDLGILRAVLRRAGVGNEDFERKLPRLIAHMCDEVRRNAAQIRVELCPAIAELLAGLHARGKLLGVASGNLEPIGWAKIEAAGLRHLFAFGAFSGEREERAAIFQHGIDEARRLLGSQASVCIVGDTPSDIRAAKAVGAPIIAVATGIFPREELAALDPDLCLTSCADLPAPR